MTRDLFIIESSSAGNAKTQSLMLVNQADCMDAPSRCNLVVSRKVEA